MAKTKKKKTDTLSSLSEAEMKQRIRDAEKELFQANLQKTTGQLEKTALLWQKRKEIARLKTFMTQKSTGQSA